MTEALVDQLADLTEGYTGAEIEQAIVAALFDAYAERRTLTYGDLRRAIATMVPLSVTQAEQISAVRAWATHRAVAATSTEDRTGYTTPVNKETQPEAHPAPSPSGDATTRGGRMVDF